MNIKIPVSWLREYLKVDLATKTIAQELSLAGPSVEKIEKKDNDYLFDIEITSNRIDTASIFGIAREAITILKANGHKANLAFPKGLNTKLEPDKIKTLKLDVVIKDPNLCPRFAAIIVDEVKVKPSPAYIKNRLSLSGIRAINNIVDISNYLMLELGQPMHTFDFDKIKGAKMILRKAKEGEKIVTLDRITRKLPAGAIVIEDAKDLIDLCGIMGAVNSKVNNRTKRVVFFVQAYNPKVIRKTTQLLGFRTEAASRFEKGIDLEGILPALSRAVYLAKKNSRAKIASELIDIYPNKQTPKTYKLDIGKLTSYLGIDLKPQKALEILTSLGFKTKLAQNWLVASPPSWRVQDIEEDVDLIEEIARIYGYHKFPSKLPSGQIPKSEENKLKKTIEFKKALKLLGLTEIISYSIISKKFLELSQVKVDQIVELANPLTDQWQYMRPNIIISLLDVVSKNQHIKPKLKLFEVAKTFFAQNNDLPKQDLNLAIVLASSDFYEIKGLIENLSEILERDFKYQKFKVNDPIFDKNQSAQIFLSDKQVGAFGLINSKITDFFDLQGTITAAQINLSLIFDFPEAIKQYVPISKYPPVIEDISIVVDKTLPIAEVVNLIKNSAGHMLKKIEVIDTYEGESIPSGKKSVTVNLTYSRNDRTPTRQEVNKARDQIYDALAKHLHAIVRR